MEITLSLRHTGREQAGIKLMLPPEINTPNEKTHQLSENLQMKFSYKKKRKQNKTADLAVAERACQLVLWIQTKLLTYKASLVSFCPETHFPCPPPKHSASVQQESQRLILIQILLL